MWFADLQLTRRLERAEGTACARFAEARSRLFPDRGSQWIECGGAIAVFDGNGSPITQSFALGVFEQLTPSTLDRIEAFFLDRGADVMHEVSPLAGVDALKLLCERNYRPIEISSVMFRTVESLPLREESSTTARIASGSDLETWTAVNAEAWSHEHPELIDFLRTHGQVASTCEGTVCFIAELDSQPGATGSLSIHEGIALFAGAATIPALRRRGLQAALLEARLRYASEQGCDLAMMVAAAGSNSQRNAERQGFRIAYTRTKWQLAK